MITETKHYQLDILLIRCDHLLNILLKQKTKGITSQNEEDSLVFIILNKSLPKHNKIYRIPE